MRVLVSVYRHVKMIIKALMPFFFVSWIIRIKRPGLPRFKKQFFNLADTLADGRFSCSWEDRFPCLDDATSTTVFDAHYLYHPAWAARGIMENPPPKHIDISSSLNFVSMLSAFVPVEFYDYRPADINLEGLSCRKADLRALPFDDNSIVSLSCMHVVEHIGLGRYGDQIDPKGDQYAMHELTRVLARAGLLYFVVPVGGQARIQFNAHRIYTYNMVVREFSSLRLERFSIVCDDGAFIKEAYSRDADRQRYGCGCFLFRKL